MEALDAALIAGLIGCFALAAALALAEVSFIRVRRSRILVDADHGDQRSRQLLQLLDDFAVVLNSVLFLALTAQVGSATIAGVLAQRWFGGIALTVTSIVVTAVLFVYAEAIPKTIAVRSPDLWARRLTPMLRAVSVILRPIVAVLVRLADIQMPGRDPMVGGLTEEELRALAKESAEVGTIDEDDAELVGRSFNFGDLIVADVMVPRSSITHVSAEEPVIRVFPEIVTSGHRRYPVVRRDLDDIMGLVRLRDLAIMSRDSPLATSQEVMTDVLRCRPDDLIADLLERMQTQGTWLAIVTDEDGHTVGLATIEDLVAELVGEIADEQWTPPRP